MFIYPFNSQGYLDTKRDRMDHMLDEGDLCNFEHEIETKDDGDYDKVEKIRVDLTI
jgi:hypothetical protein